LQSIHDKLLLANKDFVNWSCISHVSDTLFFFFFFLLVFK
jgi:hypothetical protein